MKSISLGTCKLWSLKAGGFCIQVVFRAYVTVLKYRKSLTMIDISILTRYQFCAISILTRYQFCGISILTRYQFCAISILTRYQFFALSILCV